MIEHMNPEADLVNYFDSDKGILNPFPFLVGAHPYNLYFELMFSTLVGSSLHVEKSIK